MTASDDRARQPAEFASLFTRLTGTETIVERQQTDEPPRFDDEEEREVSEYLHATATAKGLDDAIDEPEPY